MHISDVRTLFGPAGPIKRVPAANVSNSKSGDGWHLPPTYNCQLRCYATENLLGFPGPLGCTMPASLQQQQATVGSLNDRFNTRGSSQRRLASLPVAKPLLIRNQTCPEDLGVHPALPLVLSCHLTLSRLLIGGDESCRPARHGTGSFQQQPRVRGRGAAAVVAQRWHRADDAHEI